MDILILTECHLDDSETQDVHNFLTQTAPTLAATCCPTSQLVSTLTEPSPDDEQQEEKDARPKSRLEPRKGPAGIIIIARKQIQERMRGKPKTMASGRLLHIKIGDGDTEADDKQPIHIIALYGVSGLTDANKHKVDLARSLQEGLTTVLDRARGQRVVVLGDINGCPNRTDRTRCAEDPSATLPSSDRHQLALWRTIEFYSQKSDFKLHDVMHTAFPQGGAPMTYCPANRSVSRLDTIHASASMGPTLAATASKLGCLSATHRAVFCSFPTVQLGKTKHALTPTWSLFSMRARGLED